VNWSDQLLESLKASEVDLAIYVPDEVLTPLINGADQDPAMDAFAASREEEAIGIAAGAALGGRRSVVLMQSSGYGNSVNALASLAVPYQLPVLMIIGERGVLGEFNPVQLPISRTALSNSSSSSLSIKDVIRSRSRSCFLSCRFADS
jgi:sulfopyruvate decarboxylase alpha subunit